MSRILSPRWITPPTENVQRHHPSGIRRANIHPAQNRLGVHRFRDYLELLGLGIAQILGDVRHPVIVQLGHLLLLFGDGLAELGDIGGGIGNLPLPARTKSAPVAKCAAGQSGLFRPEAQC